MKVISLDAPNSYSDVICAKVGGLVLNLKNFANIISVDNDKKTVTVGPGITIDRLNQELLAKNLVFPTTADYSGITVAGGLGTGAHNSSLTVEAGIHDYIQSMKVVDGQGNLVEIAGEDAKKLSVHLGYLGAIVEITLKVEENSKLRYGFESGSDDGLEDKVLEMVRSHDYAKVSWFVGVGRYVMDFYNKVPVETKGDSYHNLWQSTAGPIRFVGSLPYDAQTVFPEPYSAPPQVSAARHGLRRSLQWTQTPMSLLIYRTDAGKFL